MARPTIYTKELGEKICSQIAVGKSVRKMCKSPKMPSASTIFYWLIDEEKKEFLEQYKKARNVEAELMFEELREIADNQEGDVMRDRLRVDTRKWYLSKVLPKKFGEKVGLEHSGSIQVKDIEIKSRE